MTAYIGSNTLFGNNSAITTPKKLSGTGQNLSVPANQRIVGAYVGWATNNGAPTATGTVQVALCSVSSGAVVPGSVIDIPYDNAALGSTPQWISVTGLSIDISAYSGISLCPVIANPTGSGFKIAVGTLSGASRGNSTAASPTIPDPFSAVSTISNEGWSIYFEIDTIPASAALVDVNTNEVVRIGGSVAMTTGLLTGATSASVGGKALTGFSGSGDNYTATMPDFIEGQTSPAYGNQTAVITNGTASPTLLVNLQPKAGSSYVTVASRNTSLNYLAYYANIQDGDQLTFRSATDLGTSLNSISTDTGIVTTYVGSQDVYWRNASGVITKLVIQTADGAIVPPSVSSNRKTSCGVGAGI